MDSGRGGSDYKKMKSKSGPQIKGKFKYQSTNMMLSRKPEIKSIDIRATTLANNWGTTSNVVLLNGIAEGTSFFDRIGRKVSCKSVHVKIGIVRNVNLATSVQEAIRCLVVYDKQTNGAAPILSDLILSYATGGATSSTVFDGRNLDKRDRFRVLMDFTTVMPASGPNASGNNNGNVGQQLYIERFIKCPNTFDTVYGGSDASAGSVTTGGLFFVTIGSVANNATQWACNFASRVRYFDV